MRCVSKLGHPSLAPIQGQVTKHTTVKWPIVKLPCDYVICVVYKYITIKPNQPFAQKWWLLYRTVFIRSTNDAMRNPGSLTCSSNGKFSTLIWQELLVIMATTHVTVPSYVTVALKEGVSESSVTALKMRTRQ